MQAKAVDIRQVWSWFVEGWRLFTLSPGKWILLTMIVVVIGMVALMFIPGYGSLLVALVTPALYGGFLYGASELDKGHGLKVGHLFHGFTDQNKLLPFLILGALAVGVYYVLLLVTLVTLEFSNSAGALIRRMFASGMEIKLQGDLVFILVVLVVFYLAVGLMLLMGLLYACPSIMFAGVRPTLAVKSSFQGCISNLPALLVFGVVWLALGIVAAIPMGIGFLVLLPVTLSALYCSYKNIYGQEGMSQLQL